jgi:predicted nucleic acid-binding protein
VIVVLDSGIWISAFQFGGTPQAAVESVFSEHTVAICDQIVAEIRATLVRKFSWKDEEVLAILTEYTSDGKHVGVTGAVHGVCRRRAGTQGGPFRTEGILTRSISVRRCGRWNA